MSKCNFRLKPLVGLMSMLLAPQLHAAAAFDPALQPLGAVAPLTLSNTDISGGAKAYRPWFENGSWQGDLVEYTVSNTGGLSSSVELSGHSPINTGSPPANWSANVQFEAAEAANASYWDTGREIVTFNGSAQKAFRWGNLSDGQKAALDQAAFDAGASSSEILDYLRGKRTNEGTYRIRQNVLGDIIHSNPVYVGAPQGGFTNDGYASFVSSHASRDERIYVGSNDGMLHAFDADDGSEVWAYVPSTVVGDLDALAGRPYTHRYFVDGSLTTRDVYYGNAWHTLLVGGLGTGGKAWFGLDITDENLVNENSSSGTDLKVLWEIDASADDDLGYSYGQAVISQANDGNTYAVMGNGYNSVNGMAVLYMVNVSNGAVMRLTTGSGAVASPNGLSSPALVDFDFNGTVDYAYAGDIDGNMWKFDLTGSNAGSWGVAYSGAPLHPGLATQPVIQAPDVTRHPTAGHLVMFGTGRMFTEEDMADVSTQAIYGIWDSGATPPASGAQVLLAQTLSGDLTYTAAGNSETVQSFNPDAGPINWSTHDGWKIDLPAGFRALQPPQLRGGRLKITINEPNTRANYLLEAYFLDGGPPESTVFDLDGSGILNVADGVDGNADGDLNDREDIAVMWAQPAGVMSQPTIARVANGVDARLLNYVVPPVELPCSEDCPSGFQGGHVDVDTDYHDDDDGTGGSTTKHTHEYDKSVGRVYIDYLDLVVDGQMELDDPHTIPRNKEFIIVVANAEMSPGAVLTLGTVQYNTVEYQAMIHRKLRAWNGVSPLTDDDGNSLIFTAHDLITSGGTVRQSFNDLAILAGGLHPTNTGCVKSGDNFANNRYRNGALVTQAIDRSIFTPIAFTDFLGSQLDKLIVQVPDDITSPVQIGRTQVALMEDFDDSGSFESSAPDYEVFGGLRADISGQGDTDAYWESTIFWHYGGGDCYGTANWEEDVAATLDDLTFTQEEFDELLAEIGLSGNIDALLEEYAYCKDLKEEDGGVLEGGTGCKNMYEDLQDLAELAVTIFNVNVTSLTGLESDGETPVIMQGAAQSGGRTTGPNFQMGRRAWTDITAD